MEFLAIIGIGLMCVFGIALFTTAVWIEPGRPFVRKKKLRVVVILPYLAAIGGLVTFLCLFHQLVHGQELEKLVVEMSIVTVILVLAIAVPFTAGFVLLNLDRRTERELDQLKQSVRRMEEGMERQKT